MKYGDFSLFAGLILLILLAGCISTQTDAGEDNIYSQVQIYVQEEGTVYSIDHLKDNGIIINVEIILPEDYEIPNKICLLSFSSPIWNIDQDSLCISPSNTFNNIINAKFGPIKLGEDIEERIVPENIPIQLALYYNIKEKYLIRLYLSDFITERSLDVIKQTSKYARIREWNILEDDGYILQMSFILSGDPRYELVDDSINVFYVVAAVTNGKHQINSIELGEPFTFDIPIDKSLYSVQNTMLSRFIDVYIQLDYHIRETYSLGYIRVIK